LLQSRDSPVTDLKTATLTLPSFVIETIHEYYADGNIIGL